MSNEGEQPTSVEDIAYGIIVQARLIEAKDARSHQLTSSNKLKEQAVRMINKVVAEERRQAKIAELERFQYEFGLIDTPQPDWEGTIDQRVYDRLTELRGENNE